MHDIRLIRDDPAAFDKGLTRRGLQPQSDALLVRDKALREVQTQLQQMLARRNEASKLIGQAKAKKNEDAAAKLMQEVAALKDAVAKGEEDERSQQAALNDLLAAIPNLP